MRGSEKENERERERERDRETETETETETERQRQRTYHVERHEDDEHMCPERWAPQHVPLGPGLRHCGTGANIGHLFGHLFGNRARRSVAGTLARQRQRRAAEREGADPNDAIRGPEVGRCAQHVRRQRDGDLAAQLVAQ